MRLLLGLLMLGSPLAAQQATEGLWPWESGAWWHVAIDAPRADARARLEMARAELALGRPQRVRALMPDSASSPELWAPALALEAEALLALGQPTDAAGHFERAAVLMSGQVAGLLRARAGVSWERAEQFGPAQRAYTAASADLPLIRPWLDLRAARAGADPDAPALSGPPPPGADVLLRAARADLLVRRGDTARAVEALIAADRRAHAARLLVAVRDSVAARALAYGALESSDTAEVSAGLRLVELHFEPARPGDYLLAARAAERLRDDPRAASWTAAAVTAGDSSAATFVLLGDRRDRAGDRRGAVAAYQSGGATGAFRAARVLVRLRETRAARTALVAFVQDHPQHADAPVAAFLVADLDGDRRALAEVAERWPTHEVASRVRLRLADEALRLRDTAQARRWYALEGQHAHEALSATFLVAQLDRAAGDTATWRAGLQQLASRDPLGFYGMAARESAGLPMPDFTVPPRGPRDPAMAAALEQLAVLDAASLDEEAVLLVADATTRATTAPAALDLAEGLIALDRTPEAIAIGWRATRWLPMTDSRLIRVLWPWPERDLLTHEARKFDLDPWLVAGLIRQESNFRTRAVSRAGARGLMQLMPATAREVARRLGVPWTDTHRGVPDANVHVGAAHLAALMRQYPGEVAVALAAYNAGGTPTARWRRASGTADPMVFVEHITYPETRGYVRAVLRNAALYRALYPEP
ncbi:MAG: transglycosylase SLT domain-containing protein [Gemmatimonadales bacterium]